MKNLGTLAQLLPELSRIILIAAFGRRMLHLKIRFAHPRRAAAFDYFTPKFGEASPPTGSFERRCLDKGWLVYRSTHNDDSLQGNALYCFLWPPEDIAVPGK
ncbi:hypothetical protein N0V88_002630 [Collariella sp. IMI 366227]|nr:hypothetical protein N0V88_002630 [Collariella sp. IMI 366227]